MRQVGGNSYRAAALAVAALLSMPSSARAQWAQGPYVGLSGGANWLQGLSATGPLGGTTSLNYNVGPVGIGAVGWAFGNGWRGELELGYRDSSAKNIALPTGVTTPTALGLKTDALAYTYMANVVYDFALAAPWSVHVGAGAGVANVRINNVGHVSPFAYQAMIGADYHVTPQMSIGAEYRFLGTDSLNFKSNAFFASKPNYYDHAVLVTLRYGFGAPAPRPAAAVIPPPPPPPPPAAAAPPPPAARDFTVFFATNSAVLAPTAGDIVREAADAAKQGQPTRITVTGHTDTTGASRYNQTLSERRAAAVEDALVAAGVPQGEITTAGRGESDLAVPTADHVNEPRNRRVVIVVQGPGT